MTVAEKAVPGLAGAVETTDKVASHLHPAGSWRVEDHPVPTGREEVWRFTPLKRLRGLHADAPFQPGTASWDWTAPASVGRASSRLCRRFSGVKRQTSSRPLGRGCSAGSNEPAGCRWLATLSVVSTAPATASADWAAESAAVLGSVSTIVTEDVHFLRSGQGAGPSG